MKRTLTFWALIAISIGSTIGQSDPSQRDLLKSEFSFYFTDAIHVGRGVCTGTRQFYSDDEGQTVYHGDIIITKAEMEPSIYREDYGKPTLTINGKLHYNEGKLDGPISVSYSYKNLGHKSNMYGLCSGSYSIKGAFDNGYATGTWTVSSLQTSVTKRTESLKYTITVEYDKGKIVSYTRNTNGEVVKLDKNGYVSGVIDKHNIRHGLELPNNDKVGDELSALMERGEKDSAIWKGLDYHYHFLSPYGNPQLADDGSLRHVSETFEYDIMSSTMAHLIEILGGIEDPTSQFFGKSEYLLYDERSANYSYATYNDMIEKGISRENKNTVYQLYNAVHISHFYPPYFITTSVANRLQPLVDSVMKEAVADILASNLVKVLKGLQSDHPYRIPGARTLKDTIDKRAGEYEELEYNEKGIMIFDTLDTVAIVLPCRITKRSEVNSSIPENYLMWVGIDFSTKQRLDKVGWDGSKEPENMSFFTSELQRLPSLWDTVAPMLNEWEAVMKEADKYKDNTVDFNNIIKLQSENKKLQTLNTAREHFDFLNSKLPVAKMMVKAMPIDQEANLITKEIVQMDNVLPEMKEHIFSSNVYYRISNESEIIRKAEYLKQYYTDMRSFLVLSKQREVNHTYIMEYMKPAKYIVKIYDEYYKTITCEWDDENSNLQTLKTLVEKQNKLLTILNRADVGDFIKRAKKSKCKTVDDILDM